MLYGTLEIKETLTNYFLIWTLLYFLAFIAIYNAIMIAIIQYKRAKMQQVADMIETGRQKYILEQKIKKQKEELREAMKKKEELQKKFYEGAGKDYIARI